MKILKLRKLVKNTLLIIFIIIICLFLTYLFCTRIDEINKNAKKCDLEKGYTCSYYELRNYR